MAREFGLDKSFLERLLARPLYSDDGGRGTAYIKLTQNYRSHNAILQFPNERFYDGELQVCGAPEVINSLLRSPQLAAPQFPVALQVKSYITKLIADRRFPVTALEIGVIAPYHAQVRKIRRLLQKANLADVKVGSVEEFQGQERRVILLSTVRSSTDLLTYDAKFSLGFLANPRRFNVAVTRAKALLIVVGDAPILSIDPLWRSFMNYIHAGGGWRGDAPTWDVNAPVQDEADYADELREAVAAEMSAAVALLGPEDEEEEMVDEEAEANVDRAMEWHENDGGDAADWLRQVKLVVELYCTQCQVSVPSAKEWDAHLAERPHGHERPCNPAAHDEFFCLVCKKFIPPSSEPKQGHSKTKFHKDLEAIAAFKAEWKERTPSTGRHRLAQGGRQVRKRCS
ncbi:P-loop containing nucleoside triphosphate hydrolase protein [Epithele typhae]|uniref:P-loop containing nucleoside triphosphate hydrolase protein n=1 Tax=Epithele typhae TaxID=378194 RepID=UPI0020077338|nr:P-loop containing nucleoside triphosphate hydrolase protein [Epithele typhae]KAH9930513.1 P-loop containing nucleoside triphosphate hydrolase protein [Epithele typhae]